MAARVEPSNFYWYNCPVDLIKNKAVTPGEKYSTRLPTNVALIHIAASVIFTAYIVARVTGLTVWAWPVIILGANFAIHTALTHLVRPDPLVNAMYMIAGGEEQYNRLPELQVPPDEFLFVRIQDLIYEKLGSPLMRATTYDGRKVLIVRGRDFESTIPERATHPCHEEYVMAFVERVDFTETELKNALPLSNVSERIQLVLSTIFNGYAFGQIKAAVVAFVTGTRLRNSYQISLGSGAAHGGSWSTKDKCELLSSISSDRVNEFIYQRQGNVVAKPRDLIVVVD